MYKLDFELNTGFVKDSLSTRKQLLLAISVELRTFLERRIKAKIDILYYYIIEAKVYELVEFFTVFISIATLYKGRKFLAL